MHGKDIRSSDSSFTFGGSRVGKTISQIDHCFVNELLRS